MLTDVAMRCPARTLARTLSGNGSKVYVYSYEQGKAYHSEELTYVFGMTNGGLGPIRMETAILRGPCTRPRATST
jgi:carboxylesterase type B